MEGAFCFGGLISTAMSALAYCMILSSQLVKKLAVLHICRQCMLTIENYNNHTDSQYIHTYSIYTHTHTLHTHIQTFSTYIHTYIQTKGATIYCLSFYFKTVSMYTIWVNHKSNNLIVSALKQAVIHQYIITNSQYTTY